MSFDVSVDQELAERLADLVSAEGSATLRITPPLTERLFVLADRVTIHGDDGRPLPAEIIGVWDDGVRVRYQVTKSRPDGFTTSLPKSSVTTDHKVTHPARIELL